MIIIIYDNAQRGTKLLTTLESNYMPLTCTPLFAGK